MEPFSESQSTRTVFDLHGIDHLFKHLMYYVLSSPFARVFCVKFHERKDEIYLSHIDVPRLSDFDARLCHPRYTTQDLHQKAGGYPNTIVFIGEGPDGSPYKATPFRCSKAPLRFPIWPKAAITGDKVTFPDMWSEWYQLIGVISGDQKHSSATLLMEDNNWVCYDSKTVKPRRSKPEDTRPCVLIFSKIYVSGHDEGVHIDYTKKRMLGAVAWYNRANRQRSLAREDGPELRFDVKEWEDGFTRATFDPHLTF